MIKLFITILFFSVSVFAQTTIYDEVNAENITDAEKASADNYLHGGKIDSLYKENCVEEDGTTIKTECLESTAGFADNSDMATLERMMPAVQQAYNQAFSLQPKLNQVNYYQKGEKGTSEAKGDTKPSTNDNTKLAGNEKPADPNAQKGSKEGSQTKEGIDFCGMIPTAVESAAASVAQIKNQQIENNIASSENAQSTQALAFYSMAQVQDNLAKSSRTQAYGWGSTAGCYAALVASKTLKGDTGVIVKASAATLLATYYSKKKSAHENRASKYRELGDQFPKGGDCNPVTNTSCFCLEPTSKLSDPTNYAKYCTPKGLHSNNPNAISCVTADFQPDPSCSCQSKGTCVQAALAKVGYNVGVEPTVLKNVLNTTKPYSSGFLGSNLVGITDQNLAYAKKQLNKIKPSKVTFSNQGQKDLAKDLINAGIPRFGAAKLATAKGKSAALPSGARNFGRRSYGRSNSRRKSSNSNKAVFKRGKSAKSAYSKSRSRSSRSSSRARAIEIEDFASQAQKSAMNNMISKDKSRPIFDIITYRYKTSAWREFKDQINKEMETSSEKP